MTSRIRVTQPTDVILDALFEEMAEVAQNALDLAAEQELQIRVLTDERVHLRQALAALKVTA